MQAIAWEIFNANYPYINCNDEPIPPVPPGDTVCFGGGAEDERDDDMGNFVTNITCEDGVMYLHYGPCCKIAMTCDFSTIVQPPPEDTNPDPEDPTTWACNKSSGMAQTFYDVIVEVVAAISPFSTVYEMYAPCNQVLSRYGAVWGNSQQVCAAYIADKSAIDTMVADPETPQLFSCTWEPLLLPTDNLNSDEFWSIQTSFTVKFSAAQNAFLVPMTVAIGLQNFAWWARLFHDDLADCDCPAGPPLQGSIWFDGVTRGPGGGDFTEEAFEVQYGGRRVKFTLGCAGAGNKGFADWEMDLAGAELGDYMTIRVYPDNKVPANVADLDYEPIAESLWCNHRIDGTPEDIIRHNGDGYVEFEMPYHSTNLPQYVDVAGWKYPVSYSDPIFWTWYIEIVAINGVDLIAIGP